MSVEVVLIVVTAVLAVVAVAAAIIAVRAVREIRRSAVEVPANSVAPSPEPEFQRLDLASLPQVSEPPTAESALHDESAPLDESGLTPTRPVTVLNGRVVATLTEDDLLEARLSRPTARVAAYAHGLAHALRPESRDRITALMKREYRKRRAVRLKVARRALRTVPRDQLQQPSVDWLGRIDQPATPQLPSAEPPPHSLRRAVGE